MPDQTVTLTATPAAQRQAGRDLDVEIALRLMGWTLPETPAPGGPDYLLPPEGSPARAWGHMRKVPHFSTKLEPAWTVAEKLRDRGFAMFVGDYHDLPAVPPEKHWRVSFATMIKAGVGHAPTIWLAICRAALYTL